VLTRPEAIVDKSSSNETKTGSRTIVFFGSVLHLFTMEIEFERKGSKGAFYVEQDGKRSAEMTLSFAGDRAFIIDHTEVSDALRGKGVGKQLVGAAVDYARREGLKIIPLCTFAQSVFDRVLEFNDVRD